MRDKVIFIVGATAAGKTGLAIKLAKKIKGEIISADSMQAYKGMDIVSQKPTPFQQRSVKHHLISFLNPSDEYNAATFSRMARKIIGDIIRKGKTPIIVGGSGLYVKALVDGIFPSKGKDENIRRKLRKLADKRGALFLHKSLENVDPVSARNIHPNDLKRVIRALEIYEIEKKTKTSLKKNTEGIKEKYDIKIFGLTMDRNKLYERINKRVDLMFKKGLVWELKRLLGRRLSITSRQALGVKEIEGCLNKMYGVEEAKNLLKTHTRRFAKRQLTWFRADERIVWLDAGEQDKCLRMLWKKLCS